MNSYILTVERLRSLTIDPETRTHIAAIASSLSDEECARQFEAVVDQVRTVLDQEGGEIEAILEQLDMIVFATTERGRARIEALPHVGSVSVNGPTWLAAPMSVADHGAEGGHDGVESQPSVNETGGNAAVAPEIGEKMADGTIYAGISPDTHKRMYARPKDESGLYRFNDAAKQAKSVGDGFRVPTKNELNVLWENRKKGWLKDTFNEGGSHAYGWYWSSTREFTSLAWAQRFDEEGCQLLSSTFSGSSLRLVR